MEQKQLPPYPLRMPPELRARLEEDAAKAGRSLNAHLVTLLEDREFLMQELIKAQYKIDKLLEIPAGADTKLSPAVQAIIQREADEGGMSQGDALASLVLAGAARGGPAVVYFAANPSRTAGGYMDVFKAVADHIAPDTTIFIEHSGTRVHVRSDDALPPPAEVPPT
ncbi:Arc family DNA-binding protein [Acidovorax sp. LjRoot117]|uniref:Arc family DNA-binding protein n=1 Tax=Acidovorax sp. LjRoot117 TaxID=3342255 RepID=UPI003ED0A278